MILKQIRSTDETGTLSYLLADETTRQAAVIDPNVEDLQKIDLLTRELAVTITHVIDTHTHADHISGAGELQKTYGAKVIMHENTKDKWKVVDLGEKFGIADILRANAAITVDRYVTDGDTVAVGALTIRVLHTPGHTDNHISLLAGDALFTGDLLLIGQAGRSDLPGGNSEDQYESLFRKILPLSDQVRIYPGHDYEKSEFSLLRDERKRNPFLQPRSKAEYVEFVKDFFPPIAESTAGGHMTLQCGTKRVIASGAPFKDIAPEDLADLLTKESNVFLLDAREPFELKAFGAIPGVVNIPIGEIVARFGEIPQEKSQRIVTICQSGSRSYELAHYLAKQGYTNVLNLAGGTSAWMHANRRSGAKVR